MLNYKGSYYNISQQIASFLIVKVKSQSNKSTNPQLIVSLLNKITQ